MQGLTIIKDEVLVPEVIISELSKLEVKDWKACLFNMQKEIKAVTQNKTGKFFK